MGACQMSSLFIHFLHSLVLCSTLLFLKMIKNRILNHWLSKSNITKNAQFDIFTPDLNFIILIRRYTTFYCKSPSTLMTKQPEDFCFVLSKWLKAMHNICSLLCYHL